MLSRLPDGRKRQLNHLGHRPKFLLEKMMVVDRHKTDRGVEFAEHALHHDTAEFGVGTKHTWFSVPTAVLVAAISLLVSIAYNYGSFDQEREAAATHLTTIDTSVKAADGRLTTVEKEQLTESNQIGNLITQIAALASSLSAANDKLEEIKDANARLEERVKFLAAQIEGRLPVDTGKLTAP
jgi:septal ring factor EnvC (AmiA/AmiB activator)